MEKNYNPQQIEQQWYDHWQQLDVFKPQGEGANFCIMIPPPNVTGTLHMGHGFQITLQDALIRYHRMLGDNTLWQIGTDHAGIATQMVVKRQLAQKGIDANDLGREAFEKRVWEWTEWSSEHIRYQLRKLGASVDWQRERFTLDEHMSRAVKEVFIALYQEGLIYRGECLVNWDPQLTTALSDLEVETHEEQGWLWYFAYPLADGSQTVTIATTRPETMLGDTAIAIHPQDERYQHLIGHKVMLPLVHREIPIIADDAVDPEFGTGCLKITPAHDFNDYAMAQRHPLQMINILTEDGRINTNAPTDFQGLDRFEARDAVVGAMRTENRLLNVHSHHLSVPRGDRSKSVVEPFLTRQWFVKTQSLAKQAKQVAESGDIRFIPENWVNTYNQWLDNIEDWCISRQLWWGHRIPAWYDHNGNIYVGNDEQAVRQTYGIDEQITLTQDSDVLDTWFSSALWPFATLGWPEDTQDLHTFYPTQVLITGFDIIFFWVARMVMMGLKFTNQVPFHDVYITGLIRDRNGQKMSKSKGNVLDPIDLIEGIDLEHLIAKRTQDMMQPQKAKAVEKATRQEFPQGIPGYGTDALRFTFCALASPTRHINFDVGRLEGYRNFCNKIWNASRFVFIQLEALECQLWENETQYSLADRWIDATLARTVSQAHEHLNQYRFDLFTEALYDFMWHHYCDWYLELAKIVLNDPETSHASKRGAAQTLITTLESFLRLLHPVMPFMTEAIWQKAQQWTRIEGETIALQTYPQKQTQQIDQDSEAEMQWLQQMITVLRNIRGEMNITPKTVINVLLYRGTDQDRQRIERHKLWIKPLAGVNHIQWSDPQNIPKASATGLVDQLEIYVPIAEHVDIQVECQRLNKEIAKLEKTIERSQDKLNNTKFINNAPAEVVEQEKNRLQENQQALSKLQERLSVLQDANDLAARSRN